MANRRVNTSRKYPNNARNYSQTSNRMYIEGNTARRLQEFPMEDPRRRRPDVETRPVPAKKRPPSRKSSSSQKAKRSEQRRRQSAAARQRKVASQQNRQLSKAAQRNREKAMSLSRGFVVFITIMSIAVLGFAVYYLQLKSEVTVRKKEIAVLETELSNLREDNDSYYGQVTSNIDLANIKKIAIGRLGMKNPSDDQTVEYESAVGSYVRQYQDVPKSK